MPQTPNLLSAAQVCDLIGIDRSTLSRWVQIGKIPTAMRVGKPPRGAFLFHPADVEKRRAEYESERGEQVPA